MSKNTESNKMTDTHYSSKYHNLIDWAKMALPSEISNIEEVVTTPYSYVLKLSTASECFYLKKTPPRLFIEAETLRILRAQCNVKMIPEIIASDKERNCFLLKSCGDQTLRTLFSKKINTDLTIRAIKRFKQIQKETTDHIETFINIGVPDWRLNKLPILYNEMVNDTKTLEEWGLEENDISRLKQYSVSFEKLCNSLDAYNLPDTLNHSDFHDGNILINNASQEITFIDWGETNIGNPLLQMSSCLYGIKDRYDISLESSTYKELQNHFFDGWNITEQKQIIPLVDTVSPIYFVFTLKELMRLSQDYSPKWGASCKKALLIFIDKVTRI